MNNFMGVASRWYQKAVESDDSFDQFISIWISFNAIYGRREGKEFPKIRSVINEFSNDTINEILSLEEVQYFCNLVPSIQYLNFEQELVDTSYAQEKLTRNINRNNRIALENLMIILNKVRNNLFHGDKRIERARDVDIVKHAYPIVREIVKNHLGLDENMEPMAFENPSISYSLEKKIAGKFKDFQGEITNIIDNFNSIPKDKKHPISILLDRTNMTANAFEFGNITSEQMEEIQADLLELYEKNKPEVIRDVEEVYNFVDKRMSELIKEGCTRPEVEKFYKEYVDLQKKYKDKGYQFKD